MKIIPRAVYRVRRGDQLSAFELMKIVMGIYLPSPISKRFSLSEQGLVKADIIRWKRVEFTILPLAQSLWLFFLFLPAQI